MADVPIKKLREFYYSQIDIEDLMAIDEVDRLIDLINYHRKLKREVNKTGVLTVTINGQQSFTKTNAGLDTMRALSKEIREFKNSIKWNVPNTSPDPSDAINDEELI